MRNLKHTIAAIAAISMVGTLAAVQTLELAPAEADKLTQETETIDNILEVLPGDGEGETIDFSIYSPAQQIFVGRDAYILTSSGGSINLRAAADTESTILDVLEIGTPVRIIDIDEDWYKVETEKFKGYVKSEFVSLDQNKVQSVMLNTVMYRKGKAIQSINVRCAADENSLILDQAAEGSDIIILEETDNGWYKVYFGDNYDIGYVSAEYINADETVSRKEINSLRSKRLAQVAKNAKIKTSGDAVSVKLIPSDEGETLTTLGNNAGCKIISSGTNWTKIIVSATNEIGYVKTANVAVIQEVKPVEKTSTKTAKNTAKQSSAAAAPASGSGSGLVAQASKYIGTKYVYGGTSPSGFDCSGLVQYCCRKVGVSVNRSASAQFSNGTPVSRDNLQPGDLVFFSRGGSISHVAIYAGNGQIIHAPRKGKSVCYQSMNSLGSLKYVGARRVM